MALLGTAPNNLGQAQLMLTELPHVSVGSWCVALGLTGLGWPHLRRFSSSPGGCLTSPTS